MAEFLSTDQAAARLGLSPRRVRALILEGRITAEVIGGHYALSATEVSQFSERRRPAHRPLSAASAWALLAGISGERLDAASRTSGWRVRRRLANAAAWLDALEIAEPRSSHVSWRLLPGDIARLRADDLVKPTGLAANEPAIGIAYDPDRDGFDGYTSAAHLADLRRRFKPREDAGRPNVRLRVPEPVDWVLGLEGHLPLAVVAADLLDHEDPRVRRAARAAFEGRAG